MKIAIIGAGLAGLTLARSLSDAHEISVFEKARGPGGRMSTRRADPFAFDHGAQYFTAATDEFQAFLAEMSALGLVEEWPKDIVLHGGAKVSRNPKYVAVPGMNALCKHLASGLDLHTQVQAQNLERTAQGWTFQDKDGHEYGPFDWVLSSAPAVQTSALFPENFAGKSALRSVEMSGCFSLMLGFEAALDVPWSAIKSATSPVGWMAVNSAKPNRPKSYAVTIQSSNAWADEHLEDAPESVSALLLDAASELAGTDLSGAAHQVLHRWRYAATPKAADLPFLWDEDKQLAACGDWCLGTKVEAAFRSGSALADRILSLPKT